MDIQNERHIIPALERATHAVGLWVDGELRSLGVSQAEAHVLAHLAREPQSTINALHASFGHKRSTLTGILDRLEGRGWLRRGAHPSSRRVVAVELTEAGRPVAAQVEAALRGLELRVVALVGEEAMAACLRALQALAETAEEDSR